jgi:hypothetical protein
MLLSHLLGEGLCVCVGGGDGAGVTAGGGEGFHGGEPSQACPIRDHLAGDC